MRFYVAVAHYITEHALVQQYFDKSTKFLPPSILISYPCFQCENVPIVSTVRAHKPVVAEQACPFTEAALTKCTLK